MFWHFCLVWQLFWLLCQKLGNFSPKLLVALLLTVTNTLAYRESVLTGFIVDARVGQ
jgi:hypothetical protein